MIWANEKEEFRGIAYSEQGRGYENNPIPPLNNRSLIAVFKIKFLLDV
jgi:hypothetical protein